MSPTQAFVLLLAAPMASWAATWEHPPARPLPVAGNRPAPKGLAYFVDPAGGDDQQDGSRERPWKTIGRGLRALKPGDTLLLRGGTYYEPLEVALAGTADRPITLRSCPGELAILDGGLPEFFAHPAEAWEPVAGGAPDEFRSVKPYPAYADRAARREVRVLGNFGSSMVPLHGYRNLVDFRSQNECWNVTNKMDTSKGVYLGPGLWHNPETQHVHVRLSHLKLQGYGEDRYRGPTDPRKLPLVVAGPGGVLKLKECRHLRIEDLVVRGAVGATVSIDGCDDVVLDGVTVYGGCPAVTIENTRGLRIWRSAVRGLSAPWSTRASHKYRGCSPYLLTCGRGNRDFHFAYSEFTDNHDGLTIGTVVGMDFHHNLVENFDDDGIYLNALGTGGNIRIYQNLVRRILSTFAFSGNAKPGLGVWIYRNVFDLRRYNYGNPPADEKAAAPELRPSRVWGDHGSPTWEPMTIYHNTVLLPEQEFRAYYGGGWGGHTRGARRKIFNNCFVHVLRMPGLNFASAEDDVQADGNLHWSMDEGPGAAATDFFATLRKSRLWEASKRHYAPGWAARDLFADPQFMQVSKDWRVPADVRLKPGSPAIDAGVDLPSDWPDPLRGLDKGKPDIGALPLGAEPLQVGPATVGARP